MLNGAARGPGNGILFVEAEGRPGSELESRWNGSTVTVVREEG